MTRQIKALSIRQPYLGRILRGEKTEEYRSWRTTYRGPLILHASKTVDHYSLECGGFVARIATDAAGVVDFFYHEKRCQAHIPHPQLERV